MSHLIVNGVDKTLDHIYVNTGSIVKEAWEARDKNDHLLWGRADTFTGTNSISARCYGLPVKSWEIDGNSQQDSGTTTVPQESVTVASIESGTNYAMFLKSDFPDVALGDKVNIIVSGTTHSLIVKKIDAQYVYIENEVV